MFIAERVRKKNKKLYFDTMDSVWSKMFQLFSNLLWRMVGITLLDLKRQASTGWLPFQACETDSFCFYFKE